MKIKFFKDDRGEWRWHIVARNGKLIAGPGEGFKRRGDAIKNLVKVYLFVSRDDASGTQELARAIEASKKVK